MLHLMQHFRVARPTNNLAPLLDFYVNGLGLQILGSFEGHDGFDGLMVGRADLGWHLEFTVEANVIAPLAPTKEHLLVIYFSTQEEWSTTTNRMRENGFEQTRPHNPYWADRGMTFTDPDGYHVVLFNGPWST